MPMASDIVDNNDFLLRVLAYGPAKAKKTWWAGTAAEAGFNVLMINGDDGTQVLKNLSREAQRRIRIVDCYDKFGEPRMAELMVRFLKGKDVFWDDSLSKTVPVGMFKETSNHFCLNAKKLGRNDVLIVDSWTALADGVTLKMAQEQGVDLSDGSKLEWDLYGPSGRLLTWMLQQLVGLDCHVVLIGHQDSYEKMKKKSDGKLSTEIEFSRMQVKSSSRPHAMQLPKFFSDVLYFNMIGTNYYIDTSAHAGRDGGCRGISPKNWKWDELNFRKLCEEAHAKLPNTIDGPMEAAIWYPAGEVPQIGQTTGNKPLGLGTAGAQQVSAPGSMPAAAKPPTGLGALMAAKKAQAS